MKRTQKHHTSVFWIIIAVILVLAAIPRVVEVASGNFVFGYDQGKHWLDAKGIVVDHKFPLIGDEVGGARGFFQGSGWFYVLAVPFFLFSGNPYGGVVLAFFIGLATVGCALWLFEKVVGIGIASSIGFFLALSPALISSSRFAWPPFVIPLLSVFYFYCVYRVIEGKIQHIPWVFFVIGMMAHFEIAATGTILVITLLFAIPYAVKKRIPLKIILASFVALALPLLPLVVFDLRHNFLNFHGIIQTFFTSERGPSVKPTIEHLLANHRMIFEGEFFGAFQMGFLKKTHIVLLLLLGLSLFAGKTMKKTEKLFLAFLYAFPFVLFLVFMGYRNDLWAWWVMELQVVGSMLFGFIMVYFWNEKFILWKGIVIAVVSLMLVSFIQSSYRFWKNDYPDYGGTAKIRGKVDAIDFIFSDAKERNFGLFFFTPPVYTYAYDFVNWWWGGGHYGYIPPKEKKPVFYLLAEPDSEKPWTYKGWMETAITGGTIVNTWTLPSGFIVQKRTMP